MTEEITTLTVVELLDYLKDLPDTLKADFSPYIKVYVGDEETIWPIKGYTYRSESKDLVIELGQPAWRQDVSKVQNALGKISSLREEDND